jgi:sulfite exporter TauE/SafE/copper chaperone CopZ
MSNRKSRSRTRVAGPAAIVAPVVAAEAVAPTPIPTAHVTLAPTAPAETTSTVVPIAGMTCRSCEIRIERNIRRIPNVERVSASAVNARVTIVSSGPIAAPEIAAAIEAAGYEVGRTPWLERNLDAWVTAAVGLFVLSLIALVAKVTGIADLASGAGDLSRGGIVVALLLGLAAGVSTCMALVGGVLLALSASYSARRSTTGGEVGALGRMRPALVFMAGRIVGYAVLGAALGALGSSVSLPTRVIAVLMIAVAIVMTLIGTRLTGLSPRIAAWSPTLPAGFARSLGLDTGTVSAYSDTRAGLLGAASFFLPCGFTQAVQVYALSTGNPLTAGVIMAVFAIGTAPGLLALAGLPAIMPERMRPTLLRVIGIVVIGFAFINASAGLRLAGFTLPSLGPSAVVAAAAAPPAPVAADGTQTLHTYQDVDGYSPSNVTIYAGIPTKWTIESLNGQTCATFLRIPDFDAAVTLRKGPNVLDLPAMKAGTLSYTCSMGMYGGTITIVDPPTGGVGGGTGSQP